MWLQILFYLYSILILYVSGKSVKIIGGENAHITEFPYMASFRYVDINQIFCSGSIVSRWNILTTAHCLIDEQHNYSAIRIYTGITDTLGTSGPTHKIEDVAFHPGYTGIKNATEMNHYDIAVVKVKERLKFNRYQNRARLPRRNIDHDDVAILTGWGIKYYASKTFPDQLQQVSMMIFDNEDCADWLPFKLLPEQVCGFRAEGYGACNGDSGGPLVVDNTIIGVISFTIPCAIGIPDVYTRVYSVIDFIRPLLINI